MNIPNGLSRRFSNNIRKWKEVTRRNRTLHPNILPKMPQCDAICTRHMGKCKEHMWKAWCSCTFQGRTDTENILVSPKDKDNMANKNSVIYNHSCGRIDCNEDYITEAARTFGERYKEHLKAPSPIFGHQNSSGHKTSMENFQLIGRE